VTINIVHQEAMKFEAKTQKSSFIIDCPTITPIEYFLSGIITCSATDIIALGKENDIEVKDLEVSGDATRNESHPRKFNTLALHYTFNAKTDETTAARWVMASLETYCSTINTIRDSVKISYSIMFNGKTIKENEALISGGGSQIDLGDIESCPS